MTIMYKTIVFALFNVIAFSTIAKTCDASIQGEYLEQQADGKKIMLTAFINQGDNNASLTSGLAQITLAEHYLRVLECIQPTSDKFITTKFSVKSASDLSKAGFLIFHKSLLKDLDIDILKISDLFDSTFYVVAKEAPNVK